MQQIRLAAHYDRIHDRDQNVQRRTSSPDVDLCVKKRHPDLKTRGNPPLRTLSLKISTRGLTANFPDYSAARSGSGLAPSTKEITYLFLFRFVSLFKCSVSFFFLFFSF